MVRVKITRLDAAKLEEHLIEQAVFGSANKFNEPIVNNWILKKSAEYSQLLDKTEKDVNYYEFQFERFSRRNGEKPEWNNIMNIPFSEVKNVYNMVKYK